MEEVAEEVPAEVQAAMSIKLADDVRKLIRDEIKLALEDIVFVNSLFIPILSNRVMDTVSPQHPTLANAVKLTTVSQMNKY